MLPEEVAVVGGERHDRLVELAARLERRDRLLHLVVDDRERLGALAGGLEEAGLLGGVEWRQLADEEGLVADVVLPGRARRLGEDRVEPATHLRGPGGGLEPRGGTVVALDRLGVVGLAGLAVVRGDVVGPEEEGSVVSGVVRDDLAAQVAEHVGLVATRLEVELAVVVERGVEEAVRAAVLVGEVRPRAAVDGAAPVRPARRDVRRRGRRAAVRRRLGAVPVEVLAEEDGVVADLLQPDRKSVGVLEHLEAPWLRVRPHLVVVGVEAGEERRPRRAAERVGREAVLEGDARVGEQCPGLGHVDELVLAHVVHGDHDDVGLSGRERGGIGGRRARCGSGGTRSAGGTPSGEQEQHEGCGQPAGQAGRDEMSGHVVAPPRRMSQCLVTY